MCSYAIFKLMRKGNFKNEHLNDNKTYAGESATIDYPITAVIAVCSAKYVTITSYKTVVDWLICA